MAAAGKNLIGAGTFQTDTLTVKVNSTLEGTLAVAGATTVGGGYGATGTTFGAEGNIQTNGTLTVDGATTLTGATTQTGALTGASSIKSTSASAGIGYGAGAGGAATQGTSKATGVTLSKVSGTITTHAAELAAAAVVSFVLTNTAIAATDVVVCCAGDTGATAGAYIIWASEVKAGSCVISIQNVTAGALSEAIPINFVVIKGVAS